MSRHHVVIQPIRLALAQNMSQVTPEIGTNLLTRTRKSANAVLVRINRPNYLPGRTAPVAEFAERKAEAFV